MTELSCKCKVCGRQYVFEIGGEAGYSRDICSPFCDGIHAGKGLRDELLAALEAALPHIECLNYAQSNLITMCGDLIAKAKGTK